MRSERLYFYIFAVLCTVIFTFASPVCAETDISDANNLKTVYKRDFVETYNLGNTSYSADNDGWTTMCYRACGGEGEYVPERKMLMVNRNGNIYFGGGGDGWAAPNVIAVYNTKLNGSCGVTGLNSGRNLRLKLWFNANINGMTPVSGFYFRYYYETEDNVQKYKAQLVYCEDTGTEHILYTTDKTNNVFGQTSDVEYELIFDDMTAELKLTNQGGDGTRGAVFETGKINLSGLLAEKGVSEYNKSGKFALEADAGYGFLGMKNIEIKTAASDVAVNEDSIRLSEEVVTADAIYVSREEGLPTIIAALYSPDGELIGVEIIKCEASGGTASLRINAKKESIPAKMRIFLMDSGLQYGTICASPEYEIQ